jgi:hypothetical protein
MTTRMPDGGGEPFINNLIWFVLVQLSIDQTLLALVLSGMSTPYHQSSIWLTLLCLCAKRNHFIFNKTINILSLNLFGAKI